MSARETGEKFPEKVTAFRPEMAVHGKYKQACPRCGSKIQRLNMLRTRRIIARRARPAGNLLADRAFSRLRREDWPRTLEEFGVEDGAKKNLPQSHPTGRGRRRHREMKGQRRKEITQRNAERRGVTRH